MDTRSQNKLMIQALGAWYEKLSWPFGKASIKPGVSGRLGVRMEIPMSDLGDHLIVTVVGDRGRWAIRGTLPFLSPQTGRPVHLFQLQRGSFREIFQFLTRTFPRGRVLAQLLFEALKQQLSPVEMIRGSSDPKKHRVRLLAHRLAKKVSSLGVRLKDLGSASGDVQGRDTARRLSSRKAMEIFATLRQDLKDIFRDMDEHLESPEFNREPGGAGAGGETYWQKRRPAKYASDVMVEKNHAKYLSRSMQELATRLNQFEMTSGVDLRSHARDILSIAEQINGASFYEIPRKQLVYLAARAKVVALEALKEAATRLKGSI